jgi:hypothetical protein
MGQPLFFYEGVPAFAGMTLLRCCLLKTGGAVAPPLRAKTGGAVAPPLRFIAQQLFEL